MIKSIALVVVSLALAGCSAGADTLEAVVGPNPLSDAYAIAQALEANGWSTAQIAEIVAQLPDLSATAEQASCLAGEFTERFAPGDVPADEMQAAVTAILEACGLS